MSFLDNSKVLKKLLTEFQEKKKNKFLVELILIIFMIFSLAITIFLLIYYNYQIGYWSILSSTFFISLIIAGIIENNHFKPQWSEFCTDILYEMKKINVLELSDYINDSQKFIGGIYIHSSVLLEIYNKLIKEKRINALIKNLDVELIN
ncbi:MAG: hypothetical protein ACTSPY_10070 [Candidatus Helarchaeota archaeon]